MRKPLYILGIVAAIGVYVVVAGVGGAPEPGQTDAEQSGGMADRASSEPAPQGGAGTPRAVVEALEYDFGTCDPMETGSHTFVIRNEGDAPLEVTKGPSSCKCTLAELPGGVISPGKAGHVHLSWTATTKYLLFNQAAAVRTNDPEHPTLIFRIKGEVRTHLLAEPEEVVFSSLAPGEIETRSVTLYSQAWDAFEIKEVKASTAKLQWTVKPAPAEALAEVKGRSGYLLEIASPAEPAVQGGVQATGHFQETLSIVASPKGQPDEKRTYQLLVSGNRVSWLRVSGQGVEGGGIKLGEVPFGQGLKHRLTLLVRDASRKLKVGRVEVSPGFLRASLTPVRPVGEGIRLPQSVGGDSYPRPAEATEAAGAGTGAWCNLYHLDLEVPADAPQCTHLEEKGELRIYADDPKFPPVKAPLAFAVVREGGRP